MPRIRPHDLGRPWPASTAATPAPASGLVNTFHQLGIALGLGILVAVGVAGAPADASASAALVERVMTALAGAGVMLAVALVLVVALVAERRPSFGPWRPVARGITKSPATGVVVDARA